MNGKIIIGDVGDEAAREARMRAQCMADPRLAALLQHGDEMFTWQTDLLTMMAMIGQVQLALRHPQNQGTDAGAVAEAFVRSVQQQVATFDVRLASLIEDGFDPECDDVPMPSDDGSPFNDPAVGSLKAALDHLAQSIDPLRGHQDQTLWVRAAQLGAELANVLDDMTGAGRKADAGERISESEGRAES